MNGSMRTPEAWPRFSVAVAPEHEGLEARFARGMAGLILARPWFDPVALGALRRWFLPLSRLWAAAGVADSSPEAFYAAVPMAGRLEHGARLRRALARFETARVAARAIEAEWQRVLFGNGETGEAARIATEAARLELSHAHNATRQSFLFLASRAVPRIKLVFDPVDEVEAAYGAHVADASEVTAAAQEPPVVEVSHVVATATGRDYWLRFQSPSGRLGDTVHARVHEPAGVAQPPTVIFGHGIGVEFDHWQGLIDECHTLVRMGLRVVRPESPWHGRRSPRGAYGGERVMSAVPTGIIDAMTGAVREWSVLAGWVRETFGGPVAFGGSSLGALTAQLAAERAHDWPERMRPDALLLLTHTADLSRAVMDGALSSLWRGPPLAPMPPQWTAQTVARYLRVIEPRRAPAVAPERIVSVLGKRDAVLDFESGKRSLADWRVPEGNSFVWDCGHFSVPMRLRKDEAPLRRFANIVKAL